ncbi:hypothetical protein K461DRAFT_278939 [Myriangium duriaei CBS 260.36]|uniref:Myb-like domain-containing protein n=1 Tax=Myriangium duriaei CBS 260.36 TaxID=1168546 RepID=A0A9P4IZF5_9PEZI|nr:hypothetical protein K461DRAFT_278939 [Myriangium duriaei CBS 260.36]
MGNTSSQVVESDQPQHVKNHNSGVEPVVTETARFSAPPPRQHLPAPTYGAHVALTPPATNDKIYNHTEHSAISSPVVDAKLAEDISIRLDDDDAEDEEAAHFHDASSYLAEEDRTTHTKLLSHSHYHAETIESISPILTTPSLPSPGTFLQQQAAHRIASAGDHSFPKESQPEPSFELDEEDTMVKVNQETRAEKLERKRLRSEKRARKESRKLQRALNSSLLEEAHSDEGNATNAPEEPRLITSGVATEEIKANGDIEAGNRAQTPDRLDDSLAGLDAPGTQLMTEARNAARHFLSQPSPEPFSQASQSPSARAKKAKKSKKRAREQEEEAPEAATHEQARPSPRKRAREAEEEVVTAVVLEQAQQSPKKRAKQSAKEQQRAETAAVEAEQIRLSPKKRARPAVNDEVLLVPQTNATKKGGKTRKERSPEVSVQPESPSPSRQTSLTPAPPFSSQFTAVNGQNLESDLPNGAHQDDEEVPAAAKGPAKKNKRSQEEEPQDGLNPGVEASRAHSNDSETPVVVKASARQDKRKKNKRTQDEELQNGPRPAVAASSSTQTTLAPGRNKVLGVTNGHDKPAHTSSRNTGGVFEEFRKRLEEASKTKGSSSTRKAKTSKAPKEGIRAGKQPESAGTSVGQFNAAEIEATQEEVENYMNMYKVDEATINVYFADKEKRYDTEKREIYDLVGARLPDRTRKSIRQFMTRKYSGAIRGGWNEDQELELRELHEKKPGAWTWIGQQLGRLPEDCRDRWRDFSGLDDRKAGPWTDEEEKEFEEAVATCMDRMREEDFAGKEVDDSELAEKLNWTSVSKMLGGKRSRLQCRYKWAKLCKRKIREAEGPKPRQGKKAAKTSKAKANTTSTPSKPAELSSAAKAYGKKRAYRSTSKSYKSDEIINPNDDEDNDGDEDVSHDQAAPEDSEMQMYQIPNEPESDQQPELDSETVSSESNTHRRLSLPSSASRLATMVARSSQRSVPEHDRLPPGDDFIPVEDLSPVEAPSPVQSTSPVRSLSPAQSLSPIRSVSHEDDIGSAQASQAGPNGHLATEDDLQDSHTRFEPESNIRSSRHEPTASTTSTPAPTSSAAARHWLPGDIFAMLQEMKEAYSSGREQITDDESYVAFLHDCCPQEPYTTHDRVHQYSNLVEDLGLEEGDIFGNLLACMRYMRDRWGKEELAIRSVRDGEGGESPPVEVGRADELDEGTEFRTGDELDLQLDGTVDGEDEDEGDDDDVVETASITAYFDDDGEEEDEADRTVTAAQDVDGDFEMQDVDGEGTPPLVIDITGDDAELEHEEEGSQDQDAASNPSRATSPAQSSISRSQHSDSEQQSPSEIATSNSPISSRSASPGQPQSGAAQPPPTLDEEENSDEDDADEEVSVLRSRSPSASLSSTSPNISARTPVPATQTPLKATKGQQNHHSPELGSPSLWGEAFTLHSQGLSSGRKKRETTYSRLARRRDQKPGVEDSAGRSSYSGAESESRRRSFVLKRGVGEEVEDIDSDSEFDDGGEGEGEGSPSLARRGKAAELLGKKLGSDPTEPIVLESDEEETYESESESESEGSEAGL